MSREIKMLETMVKIYCKSKDELCEDCQELVSYATIRVEKCPFGENKTSCSKCKVHCFQEPYRSKIKEVMKYAGPRMALRHPVKTIKHFIK